MPHIYQRNTGPCAQQPHPLDAEARLIYDLKLRLGSMHACQRLGIEREAESKVIGQGLNLFHPENWYSMHAAIRLCLRMVGLLKRGQRNSRRIRVVENRFVHPHLPASFEGYRILHLSDLHVDMDEANLHNLIECVRPLEYDLCVLTGDYRRATSGPVEDALDGMRRLRPHLQGDVLTVLGNHDSIRMLPSLEEMGYQCLMNEHVAIQSDEDTLWIAGVDDPHYYRADNMEKATEAFPAGAFSLLLSHTPEIYRQAAHGGFSLFLCGHTHGGQICLPGGYPLTLDANCPRFVGKGLWQYEGMQGYTSAGSGTSIVNVRLNCPPEVTLHTLSRGPR
ncbi:metallophosphoesterase [Hydrocarboniclastica marina]|uniref:Metallophosphoesterase n=1 Tax=Hydrocarboniclastica marina TaxID=2259620 RepID=A0A4V1D8Z9_9ALTE|nr:metallophosphoesterase [Hydrocarboniclastica marina]MAM00011.1 metallophosphoesterase [Alteromonadaceae bacterium]QCF26950.1 metallophosphoesterase [Hydrocarboniclastica marina]